MILTDIEPVSNILDSSRGELCADESRELYR